MVPFKSVSLDTKSIKFMKSYSFVVWLVTAAVVLALVKTLAGSSQQPQPLIPPPTGSLPRMSMATNNSINWTAAWSEHYFAEMSFACDVDRSLMCDKAREQIEQLVHPYKLFLPTSYSRSGD